MKTIYTLTNFEDLNYESLTIKRNEKPGPVFNIQQHVRFFYSLKNQVSNSMLEPNQSIPVLKPNQSIPVLKPNQSIPVLKSNQSNPVFAPNRSNPLKDYAIIVPCYNEEKRFPYQRFLSFAQKHPEVLICFVNDGSKDKTLSVLKGIQSECPENICVYSLQQNGGKSEAVRQGMLYMHLNFGVELIGFLDAD